MKRILAATDGSSGAERALIAASELAKAFDAELLIANVEQGQLRGDLEELRWAEHASIDEILIAVAAEILKRACQHARELGVRNIKTYPGLGDAAAFLLDLAKQEKPDCIVVGKRGRGRLSGLLLGSVSQKLVSLAPCSVLVVP
jgi:nucleotide-binding universal stress UspA family protein